MAILFFINGRKTNFQKKFGNRKICRSYSIGSCNREYTNDKVHTRTKSDSQVNLFDQLSIAFQSEVYNQARQHYISKRVNTNY